MKPYLPALLATLLVSACAASPADVTAPATTPSAAPAPAPAAAPAATPVAASAADLAAGKAAFEQGCFSCHDQATILAQGGRSHPEWMDVVIMMQDRGYSGTAEEIKLVVDYLATAHPKT